MYKEWAMAARMEVERRLSEDILDPEFKGSVYIVAANAARDDGADGLSSMRIANDAVEEFCK